jgi:hypothetical protein
MRVGSDVTLLAVAWGEREAVGVVTSVRAGVEPHLERCHSQTFEERAWPKKTIGGAPGERVPHQAA